MPKRIPEKARREKTAGSLQTITQPTETIRPHQMQLGLPQHNPPHQQLTPQVHRLPAHLLITIKYPEYLTVILPLLLIGSTARLRPLHPIQAINQGLVE